VRRILSLSPDAPLDEEDRALLDLALRMTRQQGPSGPAPVQRLRDAGFDDVAILEAVNLIAYFNYINRVVSALGVQVEERRPSDVRTLADWRE
jgi:alkylhydroperoxidase family enzyme